MIELIIRFFNINTELFWKITSTLITIIVLFLLKFFITLIINKRVKSQKDLYKWQNVISYFFAVIGIIFVGSIWIKGFQSITTFIGLSSAGIAIAMHDTIANISGWIFILIRSPFKVGHRIQIGDVIGDVIDIRIFQFSVVEIGNWVDAEQSTGRIVNIPNNKVLREPLANYHLGFKYIWNEIPVLITFESNWQVAKKILTEIVNQEAQHLSKEAQSQIRKSARKFMIIYSKLTPIVYLTVKESGILLTLRYLVAPQKRRPTQDRIWERILKMIDENSDISLAYPTMRFYKNQKPKEFVEKSE